MTGVDAGAERPSLLDHGVLWTVAAIAMALAWTGFMASDDEYYVGAALGWLTQFPYVANNVGTMRVVVAAPIALMFGLFGEREFTAILSTCLFLALTASLTMMMLARLVGRAGALATTCLMVTVPLLALKATIPSADLPELFFVACSFWLFWLAGRTGETRRNAMLVVSGVCAALAYGAHEITVALLAFYGVLYLRGFGVPRRFYWLMAAGFLGVVAVECVYYWALAGDPLHRFRLLLVSATNEGDRIAVPFGSIASGGTLHLWTPIDPIVMFFTKQEFGLLGYAALPALWWTCWRQRGNGQPAVVVARLLAGLALTWFIVAAVVLKHAVLLPRYYMVTAWCLFVVVAIWASLEFSRRGRAWMAGAAAAFVAVNFAAIHVDNRNPRFAERSLVEYLAGSSGQVHADPLTADDTDYYCRWAGQDCGRLATNPPNPGDLYFHNPRNAGRPNRFVPQDRVALYVPDPAWEVVWAREEPQKLIGTVLERMGLSSMLPARLFEKLSRPNATVRVYRVSRR